MLQELRVAEQRYRAVWEVLEGASVEVARRFGVSRQSVHSWLRRYAAEGGLGALGGPVDHNRVHAIIGRPDEEVARKSVEVAERPRQGRQCAEKSAALLRETLQLVDHPVGVHPPDQRVVYHHC